MADERKPGDDDSLLDLPLWRMPPDAASTPPAPPPRPVPARPIDPPVDPGMPAAPRSSSPRDPEPPVRRPVAVSAAAGNEAGDLPDGDLGQRLLAGLLDAAAHAAAAAILVFGCRKLGYDARDHLGSLAFVLLLYSFLYGTASLLLWQGTPGTVAAGLRVVSPDGGAPGPGQALRRWLAGTLTWLLAGLPGLARISDRWSGTLSRPAGDR